MQDLLSAYSPYMDLETGFRFILREMPISGRCLIWGTGRIYTKNDECFAELDASADCDFRNARRVHRLHDRHKNVEETFCKSRHGRGGIACTVKNLNWIFGRKC